MFVQVGSFSSLHLLLHHCLSTRGRGSGRHPL